MNRFRRPRFRARTTCSSSVRLGEKVPTCQHILSHYFTFYLYPFSLGQLGKALTIKPPTQGITYKQRGVLTVSCFSSRACHLPIPWAGAPPWGHLRPPARPVGARRRPRAPIFEFPYSPSQKTLVDCTIYGFSQNVHSHFYYQ